MGPRIREGKRGGGSRTAPTGGDSWIPAFAGMTVGGKGLDGGSAVVEVGVLLVGVAETEDQVFLHGPTDYLQAEG